MASAGLSLRAAPLDISVSHAPFVRLALWLAVVIGAVLTVLWLFASDRSILLLAIGGWVWALIAVVMIRTGRENGPVMLAMAAGQVTLVAATTDVPALINLATLAVILIGVAAVVFIRTRVVRVVMVYSVYLLGTNMLWFGVRGEGFAEGSVAIAGFVVGAIGLNWIRDRSMDSASRFVNLFERAPVSLWEEDFSKVGLWLEDLKKSGVTDLGAHLEENPEVLRHGMGLIEVVRVNEEAAKFLEAADPADLVGSLKPETFPDDALPSMAAQFQAIWDGIDLVSVEVRRGFTVEGNPLDGLLYWAVPRRFGKADLSRVIVSVVDVTAIYDARRDLEQSLKARDELIATVSHELRTPLTTVVGLSTELSSAFDDFSEGEARELLYMISDQSLEVATIVEDLLVAARAESGSLMVSVEPVDLHLEAKATLRGLEIEEEVDCHTMGVVETVMADSGRVRQIIRNLLVNAKRYGVAPVRVIVRNDEGVVRVEIRDHGEPIPMDERDLIFQRYYRARQTPGVTASVGLGLTVSRELAQIMGGDLTYDHDGESVFTLSLPRPSAQPDAVAS